MMGLVKKTKFSTMMLRFWLLFRSISVGPEKNLFLEFCLRGNIINRESNDWPIDVEWKSSQNSKQCMKEIDKIKKIHN